MKVSGPKVTISRFICGLLCFFIYFNANAQSRVIDSLTDLIQKEKADTTKVKHLYRLGTKFIPLGEYDKAMLHADQGLDLATKLNFKEGMALCNSLIGVTYMNKGEYDKALESLLKALAIKEKLGDKTGMAAAYGNIGSVHINKGDNAKGLEFQLKSLAIHEELKNTKGMATCYTNIAIIYWDQGDLDKALEYNLKSLAVVVELEDDQRIADSYANIGTIYSDKKDYVRSLEYQFKSLALKEKTGDKQGVAISSNNIGTVYLKLFAEPRTNPSKKAEFLKLAKKQAENSLMVSQEIGSLEDVFRSYELLSYCDSASGNWKEAYAHHRLYTMVKDSILNAESGRQIAEMQTKYETEKKEQEIISLNKDSELQKAESKKQKIIIGAVALGLILVVAFAVFISRTLKVTREQKIIIEEKQKDILDSIHYAKRIQRSLLPTEKYISKILNGNTNK